MRCVNPSKIDLIGQGKDMHVYVPCGACHQCRIMKKQAWVLRNRLEEKGNNHASFITLTYREEPENLEYNDIQRFHRRLRKNVVEVDEPVMSDDERVRRQVMAVMQQFIPDQGQVDTAMGQLDDIFEGEGALDDDTDLDVLFLNEGPAAVIAEMERREKEADGEEVVLDEPEGEANPPSPEPSSSGDGPETGS